MKRWLIPIGTFIAASAVVGFIVMVSGVVPIKASSGHWPITKWLLSFSMSRSVSTHSIGIDVPSTLDDPAEVMKGAGYFQIGCAPCHGSPLWQSPRVAKQLTPTPPALSNTVRQWTPKELFYIVKHGVKFTGMPAFPSQQRDDEVWAVVAFLLQLPSIDEAAYRELIYGDSIETNQKVPQIVVHTCANCHGLDGAGRGASAFPKLAGLSEEYIAASLQAYAAGERHSGIMEPVAGQMGSKDIQQVAAYYAQQDLAESETPDHQNEMAEKANEQSTDETVAKGKSIAHAGLPEQNVGACIACHRLNRDEQNPNYPLLVGQPAHYLVLQLELFKKQKRGGTKFAKLMHPISDGLKSAQMQAVAAYYASRPANANP